MTKKTASSLLELCYKWLIFGRRYQTKCKAENGKNMATTQPYSKLIWQKPIKQNAPPLRVSWKIQALKAKRANQTYILLCPKFLCFWTSPCHCPEFSHQEQEMLVFGRFSVCITVAKNLSRSAQASCAYSTSESLEKSSDHENTASKFI